MTFLDDVHRRCTGTSDNIVTVVTGDILGYSADADQLQLVGDPDYFLRMAELLAGDKTLSPLT